MNLSEEIQKKMRCPKTKSKLILKNNYLINEFDCKIKYPIINNIPILINNKKSLFAIDDFVKQKNTTFNLYESKIKKFIKKILPEISVNVKAKLNYEKLLNLLSNRSKILIIGGSIIGQGMEKIYSNKKQFELIGLDVSFGSKVNIIADSHDIPFEDETFDCVIIQAVLEHVLEPYRCIKEVFRVLKDSSLVYSETPFMQQVHMKQYDFTRFTYLGHRRLFRHFEQIKSGPCCGPGMALAWAYFYFVRSFVTISVIRKILMLVSAFTVFFLKYFDYYLIDKPGSYDAASGYYFMGRKSKKELSDKDLIKQFKGVTE